MSFYVDASVDGFLGFNFKSNETVDVYWNDSLITDINGLDSNLVGVLSVTQ